MVQELSSKWNKKAGSWGTNWGVGQFMDHSRNICSWVIYYFILWYQSQNIQIFYYIVIIFVYFSCQCLLFLPTVLYIYWCLVHRTICLFHSNGFNKKEAQMLYDWKRRRVGLPEKANSQAKGMEASSEEWSQALLEMLFPPCHHCQPNLQHISVSKPAQTAQL